MRNRSVLPIIASLLSLVGGCADDVVSTPYYYDAYLWPVVDYGYVDSALWYDGYYDPYIGYVPLTSSPPGVALASGALDSGVQAKLLPRPLNGLLATWRAVLRPECVPNVETVDYDEDGIPASYEANFNCVDQTVAERTSSVTGTIAITDGDDNAKLSGFMVTFKNFSVATTVGGSTRTRTLDGTANLMSSGSGMFQTDTALTVMFDFADEGVTRTQGSYSALNQGTYTPDADAGDDVLAGGSITLSGTGMLTRSVGNATQTRSVTRQTNPPLHSTRACRTQYPESAGFDSGTVVFQDNNGSKIQVQFNGCGNKIITTDR
jgi:hypothetical protein